jgi:hypothetical protein
MYDGFLVGIGLLDPSNIIKKGNILLQLQKHGSPL